MSEHREQTLESRYDRLYNAITAQLEHESDSAETDGEREMVVRMYAALSEGCGHLMVAGYE